MNYTFVDVPDTADIAFIGETDTATSNAVFNHHLRAVKIAFNWPLVPTSDYGNDASPTTCDNTFSLSSLSCFHGTYLKWLNESEKDAIRRLNAEPTRAGIRSYREHHTTRCRLLRQAPRLRPRFHVHIPCWRSTRWKSLT